MTYFQANKFVFTWIIENFSFSDCDVNEVIRSPDFNFEDSSWYLCVKPRGKCRDKIEFISCFLVLGSPVACLFPLHFKIELIGANGAKLKTFEGNYELFENVSKWGSSEFLEIEKIRNAEYGFEDTLKICCYLYTKKSSENIITQCIARTKIVVDRITFEMNNVIMSRVLDLCKEITLPGGNVFKVAIQTKKNSNEISIIKVGSNCLKCQTVECKISMCYNNGVREIWTQRGSHFFKSKELPEVWSFCADKTFGKIQLRKEKVDIFCKLLCSNGTNISYISYDRSDSSASCSLTTIYPTFQKDMLCMFSKKKFSDVKLRAGNQIIDGHKNILSVRSPVFYCMFDKMDTDSDIIDIVDIDFDTLKLLLEFIYTDTVNPISFERAIALLVASEKYQVLPLKASCALFLKSKLTIGNVLAVLSTASAVCHDHLKTDAMDFIAANQGSVLGSLKWKLWTENNENSELALEIMNKLNLNLPYFQDFAPDHVLAKKGRTVRLNNSTQDDMHLFGVVLLGEYAPGLTNLASRFVNGVYIGDRLQTIGVDFSEKVVLLEGTVVKFQIWDVCSAARYHTKAPYYIVKAQAAIIAYNITDATTFNRAKTWVRRIQRSENPNIVIALAGNYADLAAKRKVKYEEAEAYAKENGIIFMETSAKEHTNVDAIFLAVATAYLLNLSTVADENSFSPTVADEHSLQPTQADDPLRGNQNTTNVLCDAIETVEKPDSSLRHGNQNIATLDDASSDCKSDNFAKASLSKTDSKEEHQIEGKIGKRPC